MLQYTNIQEAEAALGRSLTTAETMWFNYTARKSDYFLYYHNMLFVFFVLLLVPLYYLILEFLFPNSVQTYKIQPKVKLSRSDVTKCYVSVLRMFILVLLPLQLLSNPSMKMIGIRTSLPLPSIWEIVAQLGVYFLVEDYAHYWVHRLLHCKWAYEKIHKVHHEYTAPIGIVAPYAHWAEVFILGTPVLLGPALIPGHIITFWLWTSLRQTEAIETHSGYDLPWALTKYIPFYGGADYHDYHHYVGGKSKANFGSVFTYCDYIYGTDKGYRHHKRVLRQLREGLKSNGEQKVVPDDISSQNLKVD